jgi:hypothetical protein
MYIHHHRINVDLRRLIWCTYSIGDDSAELERTEG